MKQPPPSNTPATLHLHKIFRNSCSECRAEQTKWYKTAAKSGFKDIEARVRDDGTIDVESAPQTERGVVSYEARTSCNPNDPDNLADHENLAEYGEPTSVWNTPAAQDMSFLQDQVNQLPANYLRKSFLLAWVENGCTDVKNVSTEHGLTRWQGRETVRKFKDRLRKMGRLR